MLGDYREKDAAECDTIVEVLANRYVDSDGDSARDWENLDMHAWAPQAETFLRTVLEESSNSKVKGVACFYLAKHQERLATACRHFLDDPFRGEVARRNFGPDNVRRLRASNSVELKREAAALFEKTIKEHTDLQMGDRTRRLWASRPKALSSACRTSISVAQSPTSTVTTSTASPMKLSEFRGKVVFVAFWASWCNPCMGMVPAEKELVERMKGRPFVMIGVNGDDDRQKAKAVAAKHGINWRSFWDGGSHGCDCVKVGRAVVADKLLG